MTKSVQIFGIRKSQSTRAAERFFKERRVAIQFVDLTERPMAPGEIRRFLDRFGLGEIIDQNGKTYEAAGLKYLKLSEVDWMSRIEREPRLLRLPLVRAGNKLSVGENEDAWKEILAGL